MNVADRETCYALGMARCAKEENRRVMGIGRDALAQKKLGIHKPKHEMSTRQGQRQRSKIRHFAIADLMQDGRERTIEDIANHFGISRNAAARSLNQLFRDGELVKERLTYPGNHYIHIYRLA